MVRITKKPPISQNFRLLQVLPFLLFYNLSSILNLGSFQSSTLNFRGRGKERILKLTQLTVNKNVFYFLFRI